jgi:hypothetical protein
MAHGGRRHHLPELMYCARILACRNVELALGAHLRQRREILRRPDRLLQKHGRGCTTGLCERDRSGAIHRTVHVDHERDARANSLPRRHNGRHRRLMQLDGGIGTPQRGLALSGDEGGVTDPKQARIGRNARALGLTEQPMEGLALRARREIP